MPRKRIFRIKDPEKYLELIDAIMVREGLKRVKKRKVNYVV
jgi:hypothetical protein